MITKIHLENFKGIKERQTIELKPITLLFGPNSAGKSTIMQALHYAFEALERHNFDPDVTRVGGGMVDLGGFRSLVHNHNLDLPIIIEFEMSITNKDWPSYDSNLFPPTNTMGMVDVIIEDGEIDWFDDALDFRDTYLSFRKNLVDRIMNNAKTVGVRLELKWDDEIDGAIATSYQTSVDGEWIGSINRIVESTGEDSIYFTVGTNWEHPIIPSLGEPQKSKDGDTFQPNYFLYLLAQVGSQWIQKGLREGIPLQGVQCAIPEWKSRLRFDWRVFEKSKASYEMKDLFVEFITMILVAPGELLTKELGNLRYVGPIRKIPPRNYIPPRFPEDSQWANGMAAWDALATDDSEFVAKVSKWLGDEDKLNTGYTIFLGSQFDVPIEGKPDEFLQEMEDAAMYAYEIAEDEKIFFKQFPTRRVVILRDRAGVLVFPPDIGVGISQLLPVVVGALTQKSSIFAVEQPELHVHPGIQVRLGDLFVSQIKNRNCIFLLETHSEHLMLRLLRRIRETYKAKKSKSRKPRYALNPDDLSVIYFRHDDKGIRAEQLPLDEKGRFQKKWPHGFFEERHEELFP